jgi:O-antigen/teichoic acid export membrane protein
VLGAFVKAEYIGFYRAAFSLVMAIAGLLTITNVLMPIFTKLEHHNLERVANKVFRYTSLMAFPLAFGVALVAKPFINIIYGESYLPAAIILYPLSLMIIQGTLVGPINWLFAAKEKPKITTKIIATATALNIALTYLLVSSLVRFGDLYAALGASAAMLISTYYNLFALIKLAKKHLNIKIKLSSALKPLFASIIMFISMVLFQQATQLVWPVSIIEIIFGAIVYIAVIFLIKGIRKEDIDLFKRLMKA